MYLGGIFGLDLSESGLRTFQQSYNEMNADPHLYSGEGERFRRYGRFEIDPVRGTLEVYEHHKFFQAKKFDVLYGDVHREFPPLEEQDISNLFLQQLMIDSYFALSIPERHRNEAFEISAHAIRIQATPRSNKGRPAPEGIHRDGYHFGSIHLMRRENVAGADNYIYDLERKPIAKFVLREAMDSIYFDDAAIFHGVSPFTQLDPEQVATRDMLILLYQPMSESPQPEGLRKKLVRSFLS
jgi:hypothetical protein